MLTFRPLARGYFRVYRYGEPGERVTRWRAWSMKRPKTRGQLRPVPPPQVRMDEHDEVLCPGCRQRLFDVATGIRKCGYCGRKMDILPAPSFRTSQINYRDEVSCPGCNASFSAYGERVIKCSRCRLRFKAVKPAPLQSNRVQVTIDRIGFVDCACGYTVYTGQPKVLRCSNCGAELEAVW